MVGERLGGRDDDAVASGARGEERVLITFDVDFADERRYPPGSHPGIVVRRLRSQERDAVVGVVERLLASQDVEGFAGALVIVTESTVRVRRPGS